MVYEYQYIGTGGTDFPGWTEIPTSESAYFETVNSPELLETAITRAQSALMHPFADLAKFQGQLSLLTREESLSVNFSPNVVSICVKHSSMPNLSFYDLPGIIGQSENPSDVRLVKNLVSGYVEKPDSLVLVTCSLGNDLATSSAAGIARRLKAEDRCVGVLTKADCLPPGTSNHTLSVLNGARFKLGHGYFVVKNPSQEDLDRGITNQQARRMEQEFFDANQPWNTAAFNPFFDRFGSAALSGYLSEELARKMIAATPEIQTKIQLTLENTEAVLKTIPEPPTPNDAIRTILDLIHRFAESVRKEMEAEFPCKDWRNKWKQTQDRFKHDLDGMKPLLKSMGRLDIALCQSLQPGSTIDDCIVVDSDDEGIAMPAPPKAPLNKKRKIEASPAGGSESGAIKTRNHRHSAVPTIEKHKEPGDLRKEFQLDEMSVHLKEHSLAKVHDVLQPKVIDALIIEVIQHWEVPLNKFMNEFRRTLEPCIFRLFDKHFCHWLGSPVYDAVRKCIAVILQQNFTEQEMMAKDALKDELEGPYMYYQREFDSERDRTQEMYRTKRLTARVKYCLRELGRAPDDEAEQQRLLKDKAYAVLVNDPYENELKVIARITSYYGRASSRFHDAVCMRIESKFFGRLRNELRGDLESHLEIHNSKSSRQVVGCCVSTNITTGSDRAVELLAETDRRIQDRKTLLAKRKALLEGQAELDKLQAQHGNGRG